MKKGRVAELDAPLASRARLLQQQASLRPQVDALARQIDVAVHEARRYREFFDLTEEPRVITDVHATIREANAAACTFLGVRPAFIHGKPMAVFVDAADLASFRTAVTRSPTTPLRLDVLMRGRGREPTRVELCATPLRDGVQTLWLVTLDADA